MSHWSRAATVLFSGVWFLISGSVLVGRAQSEPPPPVYYITSNLQLPDQLQYQAQALDIPTRVVAPFGRALPLENRLFDQITWTPDREWVAFAGETSGLYLVAIANGWAEQIIAQGVVDSPMAWSPDGTRLAYVAEAETSPVQFTGQMAVWVYDRTDGSRRELARDPAQYARLDWSPDGTRLVFVRFDGVNQSISLIDLAGDAKPTPLVLNASDPAWSPDGSWVAYYAIDDTDQEIFAIRPEGGEPYALTRNNVQDIRPVWSPDGRWLSFLSTQGADLDIVAIPTTCVGAEALCVPQVLTANNGMDFPFIWSGDSQFLLFQTFPLGEPSRWMWMNTACLVSPTGCGAVVPEVVPLPPDESVLAVVWGAS
jgi:dipeptidyl aminopeptidase/acylaminoacyl peptidase